jgi:hypothetical protein
MESPEVQVARKNLSYLGGFFAQFRQILAIVIMLAVCLVAGLVVRTGAGLRAKNALERSVLEKIPGTCARRIGPILIHD